MVTNPALVPFKAQALVFKALAHPGRPLMINELSRGERCVCELAELVGSETPTVSRHLSQPKHAGIVEDDKRGAQVFYRLVINQSLLHSGSCDPLLQRREEAEHRYLREVVEKQSTRTAWPPWQPEEPTGPDALARLAASSLQPALA